MTSAATTSPSSLIGKVLGDSYLVKEVLDQGAMGSVFKAEHLRLKRPVAIKVMAEHLMDDERARSRFVREAEVVSRLHHPHIVQIFDFDTTEDGQPYLVMELLKGLPLDTYLEKKGPPSLSTAVSLALQCASALSAAHESGIVHRDLKPGNLIIQEMEGTAFVKLLDFGISKAKDHADGKKLTGEFDILGTPAYMAPEQALGKTAKTDARGDQYSLAVLLYEILTGDPPHAGGAISEILYRVIRETPTPPSKLRKDIPAGMDAVILRALEKEPDDRFASVAAFAGALEGCIREAGLNPPRGTSGVPRSAVRSRPSALDNHDTILIRNHSLDGTLDLSPRHAFILSRLGEEGSVSLVIDLCPYQAAETIADLQILLSLGYLRVKSTPKKAKAQG